MAVKAKKAGVRKAVKKVAAPRLPAISAPNGRKLGSNKKSGQVILTTIAVGVAGIAGYFGWQYMKKRKAADSDITKALIDATIDKPGKTDTSKPIKESKRPPSGGNKNYGDSFPLKKGSKGERVKTLQLALINKYGTAVLPKYGADGDFGSETAGALKKNGLPATINESTYNLLTQGSGGLSNASELAQKLHTAAATKNFDAVLSLMKSLRNKQDYQQVSNSFMQSRLRGVRQTLVNGLLSSFDSADQKSKIGMQFVRMGLQYNGSKYSLSGFDGRPVVTKQPATIWVTAEQSIQVPAMMVLGNEVARQLDYTLFENNNKYFLVKTETIKYL